MSHTAVINYWMKTLRFSASGEDTEKSEVTAVHFRCWEGDDMDGNVKTRISQVGTPVSAP